MIHVVKGKNFDITYGLHKSPFGWCLIGLSQWGICYLSFLDSSDSRKAIKAVKEKWPEAHLVQSNSKTKSFVDAIFDFKKQNKSLKLLLQGTIFQIKVWESLLTIPEGKVTTYASLAKSIGMPKAVRAVGTACGKNYIAYLIPCHRVLSSSGKIGGYRWGLKRKEAILLWESNQNKVTRASSSQVVGT